MGYYSADATFEEKLVDEREEEIDVIFRMHDQGWSPERIAQKLHLEFFEVIRYLSDLLE